MRTRVLPLALALLVAAACTPYAPPPSGPAATAVPLQVAPTRAEVAPNPLAPLPQAAIDEAIAKLTAKHGQQPATGIRTGVIQAASMWRAADGDFVAFCLEQMVVDPAQRDALFTRLQTVVEQLRGNVVEIGRAMRWGVEVEDGPALPIDPLLAKVDLRAHVVDDLFESKVAFAILLNFPLTTLAQRIEQGRGYSRRGWAERRLTSVVDTRVPAALAQAATAAEVASDAYIADYNLWMHHVLGPDGARLFPSGKRLISHWNLRDEIKAAYADKDGLPRQRTIAQVMDRIVTQTIPRAVIDNPHLDWAPASNQVTAAAAGTVESDAPKDRPAAPPAVSGAAAREPDTRFVQVLSHFTAARAIDRFSPLAPTRLARAFDEAEMPEARVRQMLTEVLESPVASQVAREIEKRLGRKLEPQDLWFELRTGNTAEADLDALTRKRYPTAAAVAKDLPRILRDLGFAPARAAYLADHIAVDPSRGAGHALGAERRGDKAHLRTRIEPKGMDYKGYNIAVHELGHNVEQTFSLYDVDYTLLTGVPNSAFTEALAFLFQARDLELLGRPKRSAAEERTRVLDTFWKAREIAGSALVEIEVWRWLYDHPAATPADLREATVRIAREVWNKHYAPLLGGEGTTLLGIYSHTVSIPLYLFNYVLGHLIAFQIEKHVEGKDKATFGREFERMARIGNVLPDVWMEQATGKPVGTAALIDATAAALAAP